MDSNYANSLLAEALSHDGVKATLIYLSVDKNGKNSAIKKSANIQSPYKSKHTPRKTFGKILQTKD